MEWKHKKESKWLIVENRKVHCYLCGRKMLKASQRIYDAESGHYSHAICEKEKQLTGTNERRSAVKKIVAGAGVLGLTAVGVDKFTSFGRMSNSVFSSNAKDQTANPELETVITSQGIILPSLTSDPANPVAGQMWYRSDAGVTAHFDSIQNRVVYSSEINNGNVNVTSKGIVNGLSVLPNDGTGGFGPDTTSGATSVGEIGSPYTQTYGLNEAYIYSKSLAPNTISIYLFGNSIEISSDVHWDIDSSSSPGVNIHGISSAMITTSNGSVVYLGSNMNVDAVGFGCKVIIAQSNVTLTRNAFLTAVYVVGPVNSIQFIDANYFIAGILYTSSVATTIPSGGGATIRNLIIAHNTFSTTAPINFTTDYGGSGVSIDDVLLENFVFTSNVGGTFSSSYPPAFILPYVTPNYVVDLRGMSVDMLSTTDSFITMIGLYTPSDQSYNVLQANPPVSGTVYQNTNPYAIEIDLPIYATTSGTAGYVTIAKGSTDTPTAIGNQYVSGYTSSTATQIIRVRVPAGWYYSFTGSGVTFATATPFAE